MEIIIDLNEHISILPEFMDIETKELGGSVAMMAATELRKEHDGNIIFM